MTNVTKLQHPAMPRPDYAEYRREDNRATRRYIMAGVALVVTMATLAYAFTVFFGERFM